MSVVKLGIRNLIYAYSWGSIVGGTKRWPNVKFKMALKLRTCLAGLLPSFSCSGGALPNVIEEPEPFLRIMVPPSQLRLLRRSPTKHSLNNLLLGAISCKELKQPLLSRKCSLYSNHGFLGHLDLWASTFTIWQSDIFFLCWSSYQKNLE